MGWTLHKGIILPPMLSRFIFDYEALYEEHVLFGLNQIYYCLYKCTTCHHYTNI